MTLKAELADPREPLPEWERFLREQRLHRGWDAAALAVLAAAGRPVRLALVHDAGRVVAILCGQQLGPLFECRLPPTGSLRGFAFAGQLSTVDRRAAVAAFEAALFRRLGRRCLGIAYRQVDPDDLVALRRGGQVRISTSPSAVLENQWASMQEYFAALPSKQRRKLLRRRYRQLDRDPELTISIGPGGPSGAEASRLARLTLRRHRRWPSGPPAGYFDALAGQEGVLFLTYRDQTGRLLAFDLAFDDGASLHSAMWGSLDPHGDGRPHLYFDYYLRLIEYMIQQRRGRVLFGKGMPEIKQRFGCALIPQFVLVAPRGRGSHRLATPRTAWR
jgi:predicted N-acyltransferase